jgi:hypothetical protein
MQREVANFIGQKQEEFRNKWNGFAKKWKKKK